MQFQSNTATNTPVTLYYLVNSTVYQTVLILKIDVVIGAQLLFVEFVNLNSIRKVILVNYYIKTTLKHNFFSLITT